MPSQSAAETYAEKSKLAIANMGYKNNPPPLISVVGPRDSGKTTLLDSIVELYWKRRRSIEGVTVIKTGKKRFAFYECSDALEACIDTIKVSDMILFTVNLKFGLQKETLEAINMMNSSGVTKFCFVLTNYDNVQTRKDVSNIEKRLQKEFSFPIKTFCFKPADTGMYENIRKLTRYIETMKYRPIEWKCVHPHIVVDRIVDGDAYGYLRGGPLGAHFAAHIPGIGDREISGVVEVSDPCSLSCKGNVFYSGSVDEHPLPDQESADSLHLDDDEIRAFDGSTECETAVFSSSESEGDAVDGMETVQESATAPEAETVQGLKDSVRARFARTATTAEDLVEKFNSEYRKDDKTPQNPLQRLKEKELEKEHEVEGIDGLFIPGAYLRFRLDGVVFDPRNILVVGSYLPVEGCHTVLGGKLTKSKWLKFDLKSNAPYFFSLGWCRFQSIPVFCKDGKHAKYCKGFSEMVFYGPAVPPGTGFFAFSFDSEYRILGTGQILDASGNARVKKKLKLIGHPREILGRSAIVQSMFSTVSEATRFLNAKVNTASGLRGLIKRTAGRDGAVRIVFEAPILMSETVFLKCFVPVLPHEYLQHTSPNAEYVRHLKEIRDEIGDVQEATESTEAETAEEYFDADRSRRQAHEQAELKKLEKKLPFLKRSVRIEADTIDLPVPPEQARAARERQALEAERKAMEDEDQRMQQARHEEKKKKQIAQAKQRSEMRRKSAVESHQSKKKHRGAIRR